MDSEQLAIAVAKVKAKYAEIEQTRPRTIFLKEAPKPREEAHIEACITSICKAIKMDGKQCTAKAKDGSCFCGRHKPKGK